MEQIQCKGKLVYYYGNVVGQISDRVATVDTMFQCDELSRFLKDREHLTVQWRDGVFDRLANGVTENRETGETVALKSCRIWQFTPQSDVTIRFISYDELLAGGHGEPSIDNYEVVYDGDVKTNHLESLYQQFNTNHPTGYTGHSLSMSDVIELYDKEGSEFYYVDRFGFKDIECEQSHEMTLEL